MLEITEVHVGVNFHLIMRFQDDEGYQYRLVDIRPFIGGRDFDRLSEPDYFARVAISNGSVYWPHGETISPETLHQTSRSIRRPPSA